MSQNYELLCKKKERNEKVTGCNEFYGDWKLKRIIFIIFSVEIPNHKIIWANTVRLRMTFYNRVKFCFKPKLNRPCSHIPWWNLDGGRRHIYNWFEGPGYWLPIKMHLGICSNFSTAYRKYTHLLNMSPGN